jgi:hypothetical protein
MISLNEQISPAAVKGGIVKEGDRVKATVTNSSKYAFESYVQSCGCLGEILLSDWEVSLDLQAAAASCSSLTAYTDGERYLQQVDGGDGLIRYFDIEKGEYIQNVPESLKRVQIKKFDKNIPLKFKDGETDKVITNGRLLDNPKRHEAQIAVTYFIV